MILKQLRISRLLSQEQLAQMSGLSVRTIQRIESGHSPSLESLKCLASVLEVDVKSLTQENFKMDKQSDNWQRLPTCRVPCDHVPVRSWALFKAKDLMRELFPNLKAEPRLASFPA